MALRVHDSGHSSGSIARTKNTRMKWTFNRPVPLGHYRNRLKLPSSDDELWTTARFQCKTHPCPGGSSVPHASQLLLYHLAASLCTHYHSHLDPVRTRGQSCWLPFVSLWTWTPSLQQVSNLVASVLCFFPLHQISTLPIHNEDHQTLLETFIRILDSDSIYFWYHWVSVHYQTLKLHLIANQTNFEYWSRVSTFTWVLSKAMDADSQHN